MRILQVNNMNEVARIYADELSRRGHTVAVYEPSLRGGSAPLPVKLALMPERIFDLRRIVGNLNPNYHDIVHIHWASYGVLGLVSKIPFIVHCHGTDVRYRLKHPILRPILTEILRKAAAVICITPDLLPVVRSIRPDAIFLPAPIETERLTPTEEEKCHPWTILLFSRLDPNKGSDIAVKGMIRFAQRHPEAKVRLLDWGSEREQYKRRYRDRFEFIPRVAPEAVPHLIRSADAVVGQFFLGALGLSELQAMSCAKPVICSFRYDDAYAVPAPICRANTPDEVDEQLEILFQDREKGIAMGQRAREWVITNHNQLRLATRLEDLYKSILDETWPGLSLNSRMNGLL